MQELLFSVHAVVETKKLEISRIVLMFLRRVQHDYFCGSFNQSDRCFLASPMSLRRRRFLSILHSDYDAGVGYLFELLIWRNLNRLHGIDEVTLVYKSLNGLAPEYYFSRFD